jgi:phage-related protein
MLIADPFLTGSPSVGDLDQIDTAGRPNLTLPSPGGASRAQRTRLAHLGVVPGWDARHVARTQAVYYRDSRAALSRLTNSSGRCHPSAAKIDDFVEEHLNDRPAEEPPPGFPITSQIEGELRELRVRFANTRYWVMYQRSENLVVLLHALEKDTGAVPRSDIELAKQRMTDFKRRMNAPRRTPPRAAGNDAPPRNRPVAQTYQDG